jgi:hypothetical protein
MQLSLSNGPIFRGLDVVAAIMPEAVASGKARTEVGSHAIALQTKHFPQNGMIDSGQVLGFLPAAKALARSCSRSERSFRHPVPK